MLTVAGDHVPTMPLFEVVANVGEAAPWQTFGIAAKTGVTWSSMVMSNVVGRAHCPAAGVNVYVVVPIVEVLMVAGDHVPVTPLVEVPGRAGAVLLRQNGPMGLKVGVISGFTVTSMVTGKAHWPASGVKV